MINYEKEGADVDTETISVKKWLNRGWKLNEEINTLLEEERRAFDNASRITSASDGERVQSSTGNSSEQRFINYTEYAMLIDGYIEKLTAIKEEIFVAIYKVENSTYRTLLIKRYIQFKTWETIAEEMHYEVRWVHKLHGRALKKISQ